MENDVLIIGGGPAGLYAAFYCGLRGLNVTLLEGDSKLGGKINFYLDRKVWDVGGLPGILGKDLVHNFIQQASYFHPTIHLDTLVTSISKEDSIWIAQTESGMRYLGKTLILAAGTGLSIRYPRVPNTLETNANYHTQLADLSTYKEKSILVMGKKSDVKAAVKQLLLVTNKIVFMSKPIKEFEEIEQLSPNRYPLLSYEDNQFTLFHDNQTKKFDFVLTLSKTIYDQPLTTSLATLFKTNEERIPTRTIGSTDQSGCYVIGDLCIYESKTSMIASSIHEALEASNQVAHYLDPTNEKTAMVSTHNLNFASEQPE